MDNSQFDIEIAALAHEFAQANRTRGNRSTFSTGLRAKAVLLAASRTIGVVPLAKRLGIRDGLLYNWIARAKRKTVGASKPVTFFPVRITDTSSPPGTHSGTDSGIVVRTPRGVSLTGLDVRLALEAALWLNGRLP